MRADKDLTIFTKEATAEVKVLQAKAEMSELYYKAAIEDNARGAMMYQGLTMNHNAALHEIGNLRMQVSALQKELAVAQVKLENSKINSKSADIAEGSCNN